MASVPTCMPSPSVADACKSMTPTTHSCVLRSVSYFSLSSTAFEAAGALRARLHPIAGMLSRGSLRQANSPHGSLVLEDIQVSGGYQQKVGENTLHYRLHVEGQLCMMERSGNSGSNRLVVDLNFIFSAKLQLGGEACAGPLSGALMGGVPGESGANSKRSCLLNLAQVRSAQPCRADGPDSAVIEWAARPGDCRPVAQTAQ